MAGKKSYPWLGGSEKVNPTNSTSEFEELDEADLWGTNNSETLSETKKKPLKKSLIRKSSIGHIEHVNQRPIVATSLPVNVPDWSKILGNEYNGRRIDNDEDVGVKNDDEDNKDGRIPPHVYLARTRGASFSVQEGIGRTLKGRDMSRVRNAIWKKLGFED